MGSRRLHAARWRRVLLALVAFVTACSATAAPAPQPEPPPWKPGDSLVPGGAGNQRGSEIYSSVCAACHEVGAGHAPAVFILKLMTPVSIYRTLTSGAMRVQAQALSDQDKRDVAEFLAGKPMTADAKLEPPACVGAAAHFDLSQPPPFTGWGLDLANSHYIPNHTAGIDAGNVGRLKLKWALGFDGAVKVRSQPSVAAGAIFVGAEDGRVFALDRRTGCSRWQFHAAAEIRTGIVLSSWSAGDAAAKPVAYFSDIVGNVYAVDALTGAELWHDRVDPHPSTTLSATPVLYHDMLYVPVSSLEEGTADAKYECCTFRGSVIAYDALNGKRLWQKYLLPPPKLLGKSATGSKAFGPSGIAVWDSPSIDPKRGVMYFGTGDNYSSPTTALSDAVVAMDLKTGKIDWSYQALAQDAWNAGCAVPAPSICPKENGPDFDFGAATTLAPAADHREYVLAGQKSGWVYALDAANGKLVWKTKVGRGGILAGVYFGMASHADRLFVPIHDAPDGRTYAEPAKPGLYALSVETGAYLWKAPIPDSACDGRGVSCTPGIGGSVTTTDDLVFAGAGDGRLRVYAADTGNILWTYDTTTPVTTVGGGTAAGGAIAGGAAPIAYDGNLIVDSGYAFAGRTPGNVMLVFGTD